MTKEIDWEYVDELIRSGNKGIDIASEIGMNHDWFYQRCLKEKNQSFQSYAQSKISSGKCRIKYKQYLKALDGCTQMLIHTGKHLCDQWDKRADDEEPKKTTDVNLENKVMEQNDIIRELKAIIEKYGLDVQDKLKTGQELSGSDP